MTPATPRASAGGRELVDYPDRAGCLDVLALALRFTPWDAICWVWRGLAVSHPPLPSSMTSGAAVARELRLSGRQVARLDVRRYRDVDQ